MTGCSSAGSAFTDSAPMRPIFPRSPPSRRRSTGGIRSVWPSCSPVRRGSPRSGSWTTVGSNGYRRSRPVPTSRSRITPVASPWRSWWSGTASRRSGSRRTRARTRAGWSSARVARASRRSRSVPTVSASGGSPSTQAGTRSCTGWIWATARASRTSGGGAPAHPQTTSSSHRPGRSSR